MARTISEIYYEMIIEKNDHTILSGLQPSIDNHQTLLSDLNSLSKVAIWRLIFFVVAVAIWVHEKLFDTHRTEVDALIATQRLGSLAWYVSESKKFQYGDDLVYNENTYRFEYATFDESKILIAQAAAIETGGSIVLKIAKAGVSGLEKLSAAELTSFNNYINQIKFAGSLIDIITEDPDDLNLTLNAVYDPLVLNATGERIDEAGVYPISDATDQFIQYLPFNGLLRISELLKALKDVEGVEDIIIKASEARHGAVEYEDILDTAQESYQSYSGYMIINNLVVTYISK